MEEIISDRNSSRDSLKGATVEMMLSEVAQILPYVIFQTTLYDMEEDRLVNNDSQQDLPYN